MSSVSLAHGRRLFSFTDRLRLQIDLPAVVAARHMEPERPFDLAWDGRVITYLCTAIQYWTRYETDLPPQAKRFFWRNRFISVPNQGTNRSARFRVGHGS